MSATVGRRVLHAVGVVLELVVAPAGNSIRRAVADLVSPRARVGPPARRTVELVLPHQAPGIRTRIRSAIVMKLEADRIAAARSMEPEAHAVGDAPVLATLNWPEQRRDGFSAGDRRTADGVTVKSRKVVVTQIVDVAAAEMSGQIEIAIAIDVLEVGARLAMVPRVQFFRAAERECLVVDAA